MDHVRNYPIHGFLNIKIVTVETHWRIYATRDDEAATRDAILRGVQCYDRTLLHSLLEEEIFRGSLVLANIDNKLYRGTVQDQTSNAEKIQVWLGDYAIEATLRLEHLYVMPSIVQLVPWQVFACGILDVCRIGGTEWTVDTCHGLRECLVGHSVLMHVWFPHVSAEVIWVDILWNDGNERVPIVDVMLGIGHAQLATSSREFDWGNGDGFFTDRRRSVNFDRKQAAHRHRNGIGCQEGQSVYSTNVVVDEVEDNGGSPSHEDDNDIGRLDDVENAHVESRIQGYINHARDGFISCGEADDDSDVE